MTVTNSENIIQYNGNGATDTFSTGSIIFYDDTDLIVTTTTIATGVDDATLVLSTDYTVTGGDGAGGSVVLTAGALAATKRITIERSIPYTQPDDFVEGENILAETIETRFDKATIQVQQVRSTIGRSLSYPSTDSASLETVLPGAIVRAGKVLAFDVNGEPTVEDTDANSAIAAAASAAAAAASAALLPLNNFTATTDPTVNDDSDDGYTVGSRWVNLTLDESYICVDATVGAAVWINSTLTTDELGSAALADLIDDDTFATASDTTVPSSESVKAYVDAEVGAIPSSSGSLIEVQYFTASGTWTKPAGCTAVKVIVSGGGGGGGSSNGNAGSSGGTSSFGSLVSANGGGGGGAAQAGAGGNYGLGGAANTTGTGDLVLGGADGANGCASFATNGTFSLGGNGGNSFVGGGGRGGGSDTGDDNGEAGSGYGGGGGGAAWSVNATVIVGGGGGAGGTTAISHITTGLAASETVTIGAGGAGGNSSFDGGAGAAGVVIVEAYS